MVIRYDVTDQLRKASVQRAAEAERLGETYIGPKHLLLGTLAAEGAAAPEILRQLGCDMDALKASLEAIEGERPAGADPNRLPLTREAERAYVQAKKEATRLGSEGMGTEHLLLGLLKGKLGGFGIKNAVAKLLSGQYGITYKDVRKLIEKQGAEAA